jgi:NAD(P)-dependent dehydrogenase (short-subunit alcohol dehydrogenase family)
MRLSEARIVVTGGASGLGAAAVAHFVAAGASVTSLDRAHPGRTADPAILARACDVTDAGAVMQALDEAVDAFGGIDACVNCAGLVSAQRVLGRDGPHGLDLFRQTLDVNLTGTFNVMRLVAERMARNAPDADGQRGVIVNTASIAAFEGQKGQSAYAASKAGLAGLTLPAARDLASLGIRVVAIAPGVFRTPMLEGMGPDVMDGLAADVPFPRRLGRPEEFAALAGFIIECGYLNGAVIRLDGGLRLS